MNIPYIQSDNIVKRRNWASEFKINGLILDKPNPYQQIAGDQIRQCYSFYIYQPYGNKADLQLYKRYPIYVYDEKLVYKLNELENVSLVEIDGSIHFSKRQRQLHLIAKEINIFNQSKQLLRTADEVREVMKKLQNSKSLED